MLYGVLIGQDEEVLNWCWKEFNLFPIPAVRVIGVVKDGKLVGAAFFSHYNGCDAHLNYYGKNTVTLGICRVLALIALNDLNLSRTTLMVRKKAKRMTRALLKMGFRLEGTQRCFFGLRDCTQNTALRLVMFRDGIERYAGIKPTKEVTHA